jgi:hypothetical protein
MPTSSHGRPNPPDDTNSLTLEFVVKLAVPAAATIPEFVIKRLPNRQSSREFSLIMHTTIERSSTGSL